MTSITQALSLYDMADQIDRLRFQLRALPAVPTSIPLSVASAWVHTLAGITLAVSDQVNHNCLRATANERRTVQAYSYTLAPLGEAMAELGNLQAEVVLFQIRTHRGHRSSTLDLERPRQQADEIITGCFEAADQILEVAAGELRAAANELAPPSAHAQVSAEANSPHAPSSGQTDPANPVPLSPALPVAAPRTATRS